MPDGAVRASLLRTLFVAVFLGAPSAGADEPPACAPTVAAAPPQACIDAGRELARQLARMGGELRALRVSNEESGRGQLAQGREQLAQARDAARGVQAVQARLDEARGLLDRTLVHLEAQAARQQAAEQALRAQRDLAWAVAGGAVLLALGLGGLAWWRGRPGRPGPVLPAGAPAWPGRSDPTTSAVMPDVPAAPTTPQPVPLPGADEPARGLAPDPADHGEAVSPLATATTHFVATDAVGPSVTEDAAPSPAAPSVDSTPDPLTAWVSRDLQQTRDALARAREDFLKPPSPPDSP